MNFNAPTLFGKAAPVLRVIQARDEVHEKQFHVLDVLHRKIGENNRILAARVGDDDPLGLRKVQNHFLLTFALGLLPFSRPFSLL